jgi:uncharacterized protein YndB with AHSA1/START domain
MADTGNVTVTLPSEHELALARRFEAPRQMLFDAWTKPALVRLWLVGPPGWTMTASEIDLKPGGGYRYLWKRDTDGREMGVRGVFREVQPPERLVATENFVEPWYPGEALVTTVFAESQGRTTATTTIRYEMKIARDLAYKSDMAKGVGASYDRLAQVLKAILAGGGKAEAGRVIAGRLGEKEPPQVARSPRAKAGPARGGPAAKKGKGNGKGKSKG